MPAVANVVYGAYFPCANRVTVEFSFNAADEFELTGYVFGAQYGDIAGETVVEGFGEIGGRDGREGFDESGLTPSVDTGVGTAGAVDVGWVSDEVGGCLTEGLLYGSGTGLFLPAVVVGAIVGDGQFYFSRGTHGGGLFEVDDVLGTIRGQAGLFDYVVEVTALADLVEGENRIGVVFGREEYGACAY